MHTTKRVCAYLIDLIKSIEDSSDVPLIALVERWGDGRGARASRGTHMGILSIIDEISAASSRYIQENVIW